MTDDRYDIGYRQGKVDGQIEGFGKGYAEAADSVRGDMLTTLDKMLSQNKGGTTVVLASIRAWVRRERAAHFGVH